MATRKRRRNKVGECGRASNTIAAATVTSTKILKGQCHEKSFQTETVGV